MNLTHAEEVVNKHESFASIALFFVFSHSAYHVYATTEETHTVIT